MHKVKRLSQKQIATMQQGVVQWKQWQAKYPEDELKQFVAESTILACRRVISVKQLFTLLTDKEGLYEASLQWHDMPKFA